MARRAIVNANELPNIVPGAVVPRNAENAPVMELDNMKGPSREPLPGQVISDIQYKMSDENRNGADHPTELTLLDDANTLHPMGAAHGIHSCPDLSTLDHEDANENGIEHLSRSEHSPEEKNKTPFWISIRAAAKLRSATRRRKTDSFLAKFTTNRQYGNSAEANDAENNYVTAETNDDTTSSDKAEDFEFVTSQEGDFLYYWLFVMLVANLYNFWFLIAREAWTEIQLSAQAVWFVLDYFFDVTFILDILVQFRTGYLEHGLLVTEDKRLAKHYTSSSYFWLDILSLLPTDLLYFVIGVHPMLRFPRFLKVYRARQFYYKVETSNPHPNGLRLLELVHILCLFTHWFAAGFYILGEVSGIEEGLWENLSRNKTGNDTALRYLTSFYWSTITLTTIGDIPIPESSLEFIVQIIGYMMGVFIFATIVGQVGTVIDNRNAVRLEFERHVDHTKKYLRENKVPKEVQQTILRWYDYTWSSGQMSGKGDVNSLSLLPAKLRTELALHVNLNTLKKVTFFQECTPEFLHDLVLKMRFMVVTPGDLIIRKGQVAREMFIISDGLLEVTGDDGTVLATLETGDFFGEIGIMCMDGAESKKRTADVRSVGYSELFTLVKEDILGLLKDYPQAARVLQKEAEKRLRKDGRLRDNSATETSRNSAIGRLRQSGVIRSPSSKRKRAKSRPSTSSSVDPPVPEPTPQRVTEVSSGNPEPIPTVRLQVGEDSPDMESPDINMSSGRLAQEVTSSIESIIAEKLKSIISDNEDLRIRNEQLQAQVSRLQDTNERKSDATMELRRSLRDQKSDPVTTVDTHSG